ncbi:MAG: hypothetical protein M5R36_07230 [Deltaproteobacteria bacterium]|nr:hypothetical protein [Deltaproteobacteria bacterium]
MPRRAACSSRILLWNDLHPLFGAFVPDDVSLSRQLYPGIVAVMLAAVGAAPLFRKADALLTPPSVNLGQARRLLVVMAVFAVPVAGALWYSFLPWFGNLRPDRLQAVAVSMVVWPILLRLLLTDRARAFWSRRRDPRFAFAILIPLCAFLVFGPFFAVRTEKFAKLGGRAVLVNPVGAALASWDGSRRLRYLERVSVFGFAGLGILAGFGLARVMRSRRGLAFGGAATALLLFDVMTPRVLAGWKPPEGTNPPWPRAYDVLAERPPGDILAEFPLPGPYHWNWETPYVLGTVRHGQRLLTGYTDRQCSHRFLLAHLDEERQYNVLYPAIAAAGTRYILIRAPLPDLPRRLPRRPPPPWKLIASFDGEELYEHPAPVTIWRDVTVLDDLEPHLEWNPRIGWKVVIKAPPHTPNFFLTRESTVRRFRWRHFRGDGAMSEETQIKPLPADMYNAHWIVGKPVGRYARIEIHDLDANRSFAAIDVPADAPDVADVSSP